MLRVTDDRLQRRNGTRTQRKATDTGRLKRLGRNMKRLAEEKKETRQKTRRDAKTDWREKRLARKQKLGRSSPRRKNNKDCEE